MKNIITDSKINEIMGRTWRELGIKRFTVRLAESWSYCTRYFLVFFDIKFPDTLFLIKNQFGYYYLDEDKLQPYFRSVLRKIEEFGFREFYLSKSLPIFKNFLSFCKSTAIHKLSTCDINDLSSLFKKFLEQEDQLTCCSWLIFSTDNFFSDELSRRLKLRLRQIGKESNFVDCQKVILAPDKKSAIFLQRLALLELASKIKRQKILNKALTIALQNIAKRFNYFSILNFDEKPLTIAHFRNELNAILQNAQIDPDSEIKRIKINAKPYKKVMINLKPDVKLKNLIDACHAIAYYRDYRNDVRREGYLYARDLYQEIAKRLKVTLSDLLFFTRAEILNCLQERAAGPSRAIIEKRKKFFAVSFFDGRLYHIFDYQKLQKLYDWLWSDINTKELRGISTYPGKAIGIVKVVIDAQKEGKKIKTGNILVTDLTNLDFMPLLSKCAAIVTNAGGLLCHTAIISRELKKPCIVGTQHATKVFKDGDWVEVDAERGIVKKIH